MYLFEIGLKNSLNIQHVG